MDLKIITPTSSVNNFNWDIEVADGIPSTVTDTTEVQQEANLSAYLQTNTVPLMEDRGNDWTAFLFKELSLSQIDSQVRENINMYSDSMSYVPVYGIKDKELVVNVSQIAINTGAIS